MQSLKLPLHYGNYKSVTKAIAFVTITIALNAFCEHRFKFNLSHEPAFHKFKQRLCLLTSLTLVVK